MHAAVVSERSDAAPVHVLHVDDEPGVRDLTADLLEREREAFTVTTAASPDAALDLLADTPVDCVVSDYDMPGTDGIEFLERVRERWPDLPFVLFTGKGSEEVASEAFSAGATDYIRKERGRGQYAVLANAVENAVERAQVQERHQRHLQAIETAREGVAILEDERFTYVNETYAELYGYEPAELVGEHWSLVYPDDEVGAAREEVLATAREEGAWHGRTTGERADGSTFPEDHAVATTDNGNLVCTVRDISDREARERALTRYEGLIEALGDPVYTLDAEGRFTYVNDAMVERLGYDRETLVGAHSSIVVTEPSVERAEQVIRELLAADGRRTATVELTKETADGEEFVGENHIALLTDEDGRFQGTTGVVRDVTARHERERELERQNERLDEFASVVSHDLRNPLNVAKGRLELARSLVDHDDAADNLDAVARAHDRMETLIEDLLAFTREGHRVEETEPVALDETVDACWEAVATEDATLSAATDATVRADRARLRQLLENLFRNAVEYGGDGVTVTVGDHADGFYVADDGPGVDPADREQVFETGYSTSQGGTGFGLSIVAEICEAHGWTVAVAESEAGGARFEVSGVELA